MSHRLQILVPEHVDQRLREAAGRRQISKSEWIRWALEQALRRETVGDDPLARLAALDAPTADLDEMNAEIRTGRAS